MSLRLFTKTYVNDWPWFKAALKSVLKTCQEPVEWNICVDDGTRGAFQEVINQAFQETGKSFGIQVKEVNELWPEVLQIPHGYLRQQWIKMTSNRIMGDGLYWNWDSDVIAIKPFSSETFMGRSGRPIFWISQYNSIMNGADKQTHEARRALVKEIFGLNVLPIEYSKHQIPFEYMRTMPFPLYGNLLKICSDSVEWKRSFEVMKSGDHRFSEFNVIGNMFQWLFPHAFEWHDAEADGQTWSGGYVQGGVGSGGFQEHATIAQGWSWGGIPQHIVDFVNAL